MKELDELLARYLEEQFSAAPVEDQRAFLALLETPDPLIHAYCLGLEQPPSAALSRLIERITRGSAGGAGCR